MGLVSRNSLAATVDAVNEAAFCGTRLAPARRREAACWIAARQGGPGAYHGMFAPTPADFRNGIRLFTGERVATQAGTAHVLGEEACRALILLGVPDREVTSALSRASAGMQERLAESMKRERSDGRPWRGLYCCSRCTVALWRHLAVGGLGDPERHLAAGMKALREHRDGRGRWRWFPFGYTLLLLNELTLPAATRELRYAAPAVDRAIRRAPGRDRYALRRRLLFERVLDKVA